MEQRKTLFIHTPPVFKKKVNRYTVCGVLENGKLSFGFAKCAKDDIFTRKKGREISLGRALKHPIKTITYTPDTGLGKIFSDTAREIISTVSRRNWIISKDERS